MEDSLSLPPSLFPSDLQVSKQTQLFEKDQNKNNLCLSKGPNSRIPTMTKQDKKNTRMSIFIYNTEP